MTAIHVMGWSWQKPHGTSPRLDVLCFIVAFTLHVPLFFLTLNIKGKGVDRAKAERLVSVDLIDPELEKKMAAPAPPPVAEPKSLFDKLKNLVKAEPPPPPPPKVEPKIEPKKLDIQPQQIKLDPKIKTAPATAPKLQTKEGFKTNADPKLIEKEKKLLSAGGVGVTPLSVKKLGIENDRQQVLKGKENFKIAQTEKISSIGGDGPILAGAAPAIKLNAGKTGSVEQFSQARLQPKTDKGRIGKLGGPTPEDQPKLGLKDRIIARDAEIGDIGRTSRVPQGGALATKQDAGKFDGGSSAGPAAGLGSQVAAVPKLTPKLSAPVRVEKKNEGPKITGPLKDRPRQKEVLPEYPYWAQSKGIEATVVLGFTVTPDGNVKEAIEVIRTSGYHKLDEEAKMALRKWKWVPVADGANRDEVGQITFTFELN